MNNVFNTPFENSLRVLLILSVYKENSITSDMITAIDFIAVNGKALGLSQNDLHGKNMFSLCEYTLRRELIGVAIKDLVLRGLISIEKRSNGFCYKINENGNSVASKLDTDYSQEYLNAIYSTINFATGKNEQQLISYINKQTTKRTGESNE